MKKVVKGFTLIELMIVVAIIGILAAIAIPNFLKYQLRAKFGEMPTAINAWFKAEESLRQSERTIPGHTVTGQYFQTGALPATCTPGPTKNAWINTDVATANSIDWVVEGSTYGCYNSLVGAVNAADNLFGGSISMWSVSDIDGDAVNACVALFKPVIGANGDPTATGAAPDTAAACGINAAAPWSQIHRAPDDNTF